MIFQLLRRIFYNLLWVALFAAWAYRGFTDEITPLNIILLCLVLYCDPWVIEVFYDLTKFLLRPIWRLAHGVYRLCRPIGQHLPPVNTIFLYLIFFCLLVMFITTIMFCKELSIKLKELSYTLFSIKELVMKATLHFESRVANYTIDFADE